MTHSPVYARSLWCTVYPIHFEGQVGRHRRITKRGRREKGGPALIRAPRPWNHTAFRTDISHPAGDLGIGLDKAQRWLLEGGSIDSCMITSYIMRLHGYVSRGSCSLRTATDDHQDIPYGDTGAVVSGPLHRIGIRFGPCVKRYKRSGRGSICETICIVFGACREDLERITTGHSRKTPGSWCPLQRAVNRTNGIGPDCIGTNTVVGIDPYQVGRKCKSLHG